jgi:PhnB protein
MDYPPLIPYLTVSDAAGAIEFYKNAFGAIELRRHYAGESPTITHSHLLINGGTIFLADDFSGMMGGKCMTPEALGGSPITLHLVLDDVDSFWARAVGAGATVVMELADQFWGDRYGQLLDPYGHKWSLGQEKVKLTEEEIHEAAKQVFGQKNEAVTS